MLRDQRMLLCLVVNGRRERESQGMFQSIHSGPILGVVSLAFVVSSGTAATKPNGTQVDADFEWIAPTHDSKIRYLAQRTRGGKILLTPDEGFFPKLGLTADDVSAHPDSKKLNGGKSFGEVSGWDQGEAIEWGIWVENGGEMGGTLNFSGLLSESDFTLSVDGRPVRRGSGAFGEIGRGKHVIRLEKTSPGASGAKFHWLALEGPAAKRGAVVRKRWRPAAAHTRFTSSKSTGDIRLWVMEMDAAPGELGFYSPITTPFGYYGPTWRPDGTVNSGFNFSLWSYGRGKKAPPIEQLSHLIAVGNSEAKFSGFGHEGTGVKIRGWEPLKGRQGQRQAIALRVEPGENYDTYFSYFYASDEERWRFFGAGRKFNKARPLKSLWVGSFVEVPGPPQRQRTGPYPRRMRYRGWVMDAEGRWTALDQMRNGNIDEETGLTHTNRGLTDDGRFYLETGGWGGRKPPAGADIVRDAGARRPIPKFMKPESLRPLMGLPSEVEKVEVRRRNGRVEVRFKVRDAGREAKATVYYGEREGLTFVERWPRNAVLEDVNDGWSNASLPGVQTGSPLFVRVLLENQNGRFWSSDTVKMK